MNTLLATREFVRIISDNDERLLDILERAKKSKSPGFYLCVGSTKSSDIEGISAAGSTAEARRLTPRFDAEALVLGQTTDGESIPVSPAGIVSPVVLARASLKVLGRDLKVVDCGSFMPPRIDSIKAGNLPAECVSTGAALPEKTVRELFEKGKEVGREAARNNDIVMIAECVPGGTTTAMAVLTALGYQASDSVSSSVPLSNHKLRWRVLRKGFKMAGMPMPRLKKVYEKPANMDPLAIVARLGDPMQPFAAGMALEASKHGTVVLAGGSQMIAVYAIIKELCKKGTEFFDPDNLAIITTKWVALDPSANTRRLADDVGAPLACPMLNLLGSRHQGLKAYEEGHVKEGVGAGAAVAIASLIKDIPPETLLASIDQCYKELVPFAP